MAAPLSRRGDYRHWDRIDTRWKDNDLYGHVNNVEYYSYFDSVVNRYLIREGGLDIHEGGVIGLCVESLCRFHAPVAFPASLEVGLRLLHLGRSSVRYGLGLFSAGEPLPSAEGEFVHVFVDRASRRPQPLEGRLRTALEALQTP